jgi:hypothetical protein
METIIPSQTVYAIIIAQKTYCQYKFQNRMRPFGWEEEE